MGSLKIALAQINPVLGDLKANVELIAEAAKEAWLCGADVLVTPELALCGYPPEDLLFRQDFFDACDQALDELAGRIDKVTLVVGHPECCAGQRFNSATVISKGKRLGTYHKQHLPNMEVFDELRYFSSGNSPLVVDINGVSCGIVICEDIWNPDSAALAREAGAELLLVLNASPYYLRKQFQRIEVAARRVKETGIPLIYVNMVGGQDELLFDGGSFALGRSGALMLSHALFETGLPVVEYEAGDIVPGGLSPIMPEEAEVYQALVLGLRDYVQKNAFAGVLVGLSGGVDSALTVCIAVDALGADRVRAVMMASPYTAQMSVDDSRAMVQALGIAYDEIPIQPGMEAFSAMLAPQFAGLPVDVTEENIQARIRGALLMALSNKTGYLVLTTGNKSEVAVGYCTLYGDMVGGFSVLKDVYKTFVYRLCRYRNAVNPEHSPIPENIIVRPPSAELRPDQTDQDSLPPYEILDAIVRGYMEENLSPEALVAEGLPAEDVRRVIRLISIAEYKRRQAAIGVRITPRGFGKDWRYPITNRYRGEF